MTRWKNRRPQPGEWQDVDWELGHLRWAVTNEGARWLTIWRCTPRGKNRFAVDAETWYDLPGFAVRIIHSAAPLEPGDRR